MNQSALHVDFVPTAYYVRNPNAAADARQLRADRRPQPSTSCGRCGRIPAPTEPISSASTARTARWLVHRRVRAAVYRGDRLPAELYGNVFVAEPAANLVGRHHVKDDGTTLRGEQGVRARGVHRVDRRALPSGVLSTAPDGTLYIVDMYRGVIQQRADITEYLRDHIVRRSWKSGTSWPHLPRRARNDAPRHDAGCCRRRRRRNSWRHCRIRTAGGVTRRSACSWSAARTAVVPALAAGRGRRRTGGRGFTRCGRSTASTD